MCIFYCPTKNMEKLFVIQLADTMFDEADMFVM